MVSLELGAFQTSRRLASGVLLRTIAPAPNVSGVIRILMRSPTTSKLRRKSPLAFLFSSLFLFQALCHFGYFRKQLTYGYF